ncbi:MAG: hypothetical protein N4A32_09930 [Marinifilaceae bacterium]|jgi:hypothetical protein|nr:hypothetical protein [Marinifilaceae bacterium]
MNKNYLYLGLILFFALTSCNNNKQESGIPVASIYKKYLFKNEIQKIIPDNTSEQDSTLIANKYIKQWLIKQLLLHKAESNLNSEEKDIQKLIESYRASILTHRYIEKLIDQKLEIKHTDDTLKEYYNKYKSNFILSYDIVKGMYIKIPANAPGIKRIELIYNSNNEKEKEELKNYCLLNATNYDKFDSKWIDLNTILSHLPREDKNLRKNLKKYKHIKVKDEEYIYFVKIIDFQAKLTQAPFEYIKNDIIQIFNNKMRINFENKLEKDLYKEAEEKNIFKRY